MQYPDLSSKALYEEVLGQTDNAVRVEKVDELQNLKEISNKLHEAVSALHEEENAVFREESYPLS